MRQTISILLAVLLQGCVYQSVDLAGRDVVDHQRFTDAPPGWPELKITDHINVPPEVISQRCPREVYACAYVDLCKRTCDILFARHAYVPALLKHELQHCFGRDHVGEKTLQMLFKAVENGACDGK